VSVRGNKGIIRSPVRDKTEQQSACAIMGVERILAWRGGNGELQRAVLGKKGEDERSYRG